MNTKRERLGWPDMKTMKGEWPPVKALKSEEPLFLERRKNPEYGD